MEGGAGPRCCHTGVGAGLFLVIPGGQKRTEAVTRTGSRLAGLTFCPESGEGPLVDAGLKCLTCDPHGGFIRTHHHGG